MSADAVDFRFNILHAEQDFRHQVHFILQKIKTRMKLTYKNQQQIITTTNLEQLKGLAILECITHHL